MNKEEIIDYLEKRYKHTKDSDLKISINTINNLQQELKQKNKIIEEIKEKYKRGKKAFDSGNWCELNTFLFFNELKNILEPVELEKGDSNEQIKSWNVCEK